MKNNKSNFTNRIAVLIAVLLPVVFLAGWIWQVLNSGSENRVYIACMGGIVLVGYMGVFIKLIKAVFLKANETDPWRKDFTGYKTSAAYSRTKTADSDINNKTKPKNTQFGVIFALFAIAILLKDIRRKGGIHSIDEALTTGFMILVMVLIAIGNVRTNSQKRTNRNNTPDYNRHKDTELFAEDCENTGYDNNRITFYCPYCDKKLEQGFEYCPHCGEKLRR